MKINFSTFLSLSVVLLLTQGCFFGSDDSDDGKDLDVDMSEQEAAQPPAKNIKYDDVAPSPIPSSGKIPASAVINWQNFFKPAPNAKERELLAQKLSKWSDTDSPAELLKKGHGELALGRYRAAEVSFRKVLRLDNENIEAELQLASIFIKKGDITNAFEFLAKIKDAIGYRDDIPQSFIFKYRYTLALGYLARGDRNKGHAVLSDLVKVEKTFSPAYVALATSYLQSNKDSVAEFVARRGLDSAKENPALYNVLGVIALKKNKEVEAANWFGKALELSPNYSQALINRANLALHNLEYDSAVSDLQKALESDTGNVEALVALGLVQRKQGNLKGANESLSKAVSVAPESPIARFNLGVLMADDLKRPNVALRLFHEVVQSATPGSQIESRAKGYIHDLKQGSGTY